MRFVYLPIGSVLVDDALDVAKSISCANPNAVIFVLAPQIHPSTDQSSVIGHRRALEDKMMASLCCTCIDTNFGHDTM